MSELNKHVATLVKENNESFSIILNPEQQKVLSSLSSIYIEDFSTPLYERQSVRSNLRFFKKWYNYKNNLDTLIECFGLKHVEKERAKNIEYNDYVMIRIAISFMQSNAKIMLVEPLHGLHTKTIKKLLRVLSEKDFNNKNFCFIFNQVNHAMIVSDNVYRYKDNKFDMIEIKEAEDEVSLPSQAFRLIVKIEDKTLFIKPEEVDYIEAEDGKSWITVRSESYRSDYTLKELEERLKPYGFFRCHRSYIINLQKVNEIITWSKNSYSIKLQHEDKNYIPLSRQKVTELNMLFMGE